MGQQSNWDEKTKLLYKVDKKMDRLLKKVTSVQATTTTTTTTP